MDAIDKLHQCVQELHQKGAISDEVFSSEYLGCPVENFYINTLRDNVKLREAAQAAYKHLDTYGAVSGGSREEMESQEKVFTLLRLFQKK